MAAVTINTADQARTIRHLENVTITNQTAASTAVTKAVRVPSWAKSMSFYLFVDSMAGTGETLDFVVGHPDFGSTTRFAAPTDDTDIATLGNTPWNGITQITAAGPSVVEVNIGPDYTDDDTGSATASCIYFVKAILPPWVTYTYTTADGGDDADYAFRIVAVFRPY
jgi:hypothetical protein